MAAGGVLGAIENVEANLDSLTDASYVQATRSTIDTLRARLSETAEAVRA